jgi:hypothetical protein
MGNECCANKEEDQEVIKAPAISKVQKAGDVIYDDNNLPFFELNGKTLNSVNFKVDEYKRSQSQASSNMGVEASTDVRKRFQDTVALLKDHGVEFSFNLTNYNGARNPYKMMQLGSSVYMGQVKESNSGSGGAVKQGRGYLLKEDNSLYQGYWYQDEYYGPGLLFEPSKKDAKFGFWVQGHLDSDTEVRFDDKKVYNGDYRNKNMNGQGVLRWPNGEVYSGRFVDGKYQGKGKFTWPNNDQYSGDWYNDKMHGKGIFEWAEGTRHEGEYKDGKKEGYGIMKWKNGSEYQGQWANGVQHGEGIYIKSDGKKRHGVWTNGVITSKDSKSNK